MATTAQPVRNKRIETDIPQRLDPLPWSKWHTRIIIALGTSWLLDGLEVTIVGSLSGILGSSAGLSLTDKQITGAATTCLGRRKLFLVTLATYSLATIATAISWNFLSFSVFRFFTGFGIGGEYSAINSAVDELIPGRLRGAIDLIVNGTFWLGATAGSVAATLLLAGYFPQNTRWRYAFGVGGTLGIAIFFLRPFVPESPPWLLLHGYEKEADDIVSSLEYRVSHGHPEQLAPRAGEKLRIRVRSHTPLREVFHNMAGENRERSILGLVLVGSQAFFFNAVFFSYALVVKTFFHVSDRDLPMHLLPFAVASFLGPLTLGRLFDRIGRKPMITATYATSGTLLVGVLYPFAHGTLGARGMQIIFSIIFFVASSAASAAYLTVSEIFPLEMRALAIAIFYSLGTAIGGVGAPVLFGVLIATGSRTNVALGYALGAALMISGAVCEHRIGVEAAGRSLESISKPLQSAD